MAITITSDSATISTTTWYLASDSSSATYQTADVILQVWLDLSAMAAGDQFSLAVLEKVNAGTARTVYAATFTGAQSELAVTPSLIVGEGWEVSLVKNSGTDRSLAWSLRTIA